MQTYGDKLKRFNRVLQDIKSVKIQGATNIAKSALGAYFLFPTEKSRKKLSSLRVTEHLPFNVLEKAKNHSKKKNLQKYTRIVIQPPSLTLLSMPKRKEKYFRLLIQRRAPFIKGEKHQGKFHVQVLK